LKRTFHITRDTAATTHGDVLLCELSQHHVCTAVAHTASKEVQQINYYELKNGLPPDTLRSIIETEKLVPDSIKRVVVSNASKEVVLVPAPTFTEAHADQIYTSLYNRDGHSLYFDAINAYNLVVVHALPKDLIVELEHLSLTQVTHNFACLLHSSNDLDTETGIAVQFTGKEIRVAAKKDGELKLVQTYFYSTPHDVLYYLLAVCQQYGLSQADTLVVLSGLVSPDSTIFKALYQYFSELHFWKPAAKMTLQSEHPPHFFSTLYNLAACVL
jgi:hypothetical protein